MKARFYLLAVVVAPMAVGFLVGCELASAPVSIDQRITDFQADLNNTVRTSAYLNFHPTMTSDYNALKDGSTITTYFPAPDGSGTAYVLTVTDESSPSTGVIVTASGGPTAFGGPKYLKLVMAVTGTADYRIVSLEIETSAVFPGPAQIQ